MHLITRAHLRTPRASTRACQGYRNPVDLDDGLALGHSDVVQERQVSDWRNCDGVLVHRELRKLERARLHVDAHVQLTIVPTAVERWAGSRDDRELQNSWNSRQAGFESDAKVRASTLATFKPEVLFFGLYVKIPAK
eukprot:12786711-Heterocapsa_arctica.AAC.2